jgi:hypothetical protein
VSSHQLEGLSLFGCSCIDNIDVSKKKHLELLREKSDDLKNARSTLKDVLMTVKAGQNDRDKFPHIGDAQLFERNSLVHTSKERLVKAKGKSLPRQSS